MSMEMSFSYDDYAQYYADSELLRPKYLDPKSIVTAVFDKDEEHETFLRNQMNDRLGDGYFQKLKKSQDALYEYCKSVFPAYSFLYRDIITEDWLAIVDIHKDYSRDHSIHQPLTAYVVSKLLGGGSPEEAFHIAGKSLLDLAVEAIVSRPETNYLRNRLSALNPHSPLLKDYNRRYWYPFVYYVAIQAALFHDIGYPWQFISNLHNSMQDDSFILSPRLNPESLLNIGKVVFNYDGIQGLKQQYREQIVFYPFYDYGLNSKTLLDSPNDIIREALLTTHGLPGALAYLYYQQKYTQAKKVSDRDLIFAQEWAALAILMHDMKEIYVKHSADFSRLNFNVDPLSCILTLADTLEDFDRPKAFFSKPTKSDYQPNTVLINYSFPTREVSIKEDNGQLSISFMQVGSDDFIEKQSKRKKNEEDGLFNPSHGYFDLSSLGLTEVTETVLKVD